MKRFALVGGLLAAGLAYASTPQFWEMSTFNDFLKGKFDGVSLGRDGRLSIAPKLETLFASEQPVIWSTAATPDGSLYVATGHRGRVFRIGQDGKAALVWTSDRPEVFAVATDAKGNVYAASSPDGKIYRLVNGTAVEYFDPKAKYIWSLAVAPDGVLYAGTGDGGKVFRITGPGQGEEYYNTTQNNVTSLILDAQGRLLAGTEPNGILYRITAKDKAFVLYDSSLPEIRAVSPMPDGSVLAVGLGGALAKKVTAAQAAAAGGAGAGGATFSTSITVTADSGAEIKPTDPKAAQQAQLPAAQNTAQPTVTSGLIDLSQIEKSAIYRINADNTVETLWSSKEENVYDILPAADGQLFFGTDANGRVYRLSADHKLTLFAQTNDAEAMRLLRWNGTLVAATANLGKLYALRGNNTAGSYESPVYDSNGVAQWGRLKWQGAQIAVRTRSGNSIRPDKTWSDWSEPLAESGGQISSPNARYLQYAVEFKNAGAFAENISASYLPQNLPPVIRSITVLTNLAAPAAQARQQSNNTASNVNSPYTVTVTDTGDAGPAASTGTPTQTLSRAATQQLTVTWNADDPEQDKLVYKLEYKGDGEQEWKTIRTATHENTLLLDGDALADGRYLFRVTASDKESNPPKAAREAELISAPVLIDNTPPVLSLGKPQRKGEEVDLDFSAQDAVSALRRAEYAVDGGSWLPIAPNDGILDSMKEDFHLHAGGLTPGEHTLVIRVADSGNNAALAKVVLR